MTDDMIERVARAVEIAAKVNGRNWDKIARAAIEAMREPTEAMLDYGTRPTWQTMIDMALKES